MAKPKLTLVVNTATCELCFRETQEYSVVDGVFQCQSCASGETAARKQEDAEWAEFERRIKEAAEKTE